MKVAAIQMVSGCEVQANLKAAAALLEEAARQGAELAVEVGETDLVIVNQVQCPHAAAGQGLHGIPPHTADAENRHPGVGQPVHSLLT